VSRGGRAPTGRAIAAQPAGSIDGRPPPHGAGRGWCRFKYANRGTAAYQTELLAASVLEHSLKSEARAGPRPHHRVRRGDGRTVGRRPRGPTGAWSSTLASWTTSRRRAPSKKNRPPETSAPGPPGGPAFGRSRTLRAIPWVFAWTQNRHCLPRLVRAGPLASRPFSTCAGRGARPLLKRMFTDFRLFRLVMDEVEKKHSPTSISTSPGGTPSWCPIRGCARRFFRWSPTNTIGRWALCARLTGCTELAERFPQFRQRLASRLAHAESGEPPADRAAATLPRDDGRGSRRRTSSRRCCCRLTASPLGSETTGYKTFARRPRRHVTRTPRSIAFFVQLGVVERATRLQACTTRSTSPSTTSRCARWCATSRSRFVKPRRRAPLRRRERLPVGQRAPQWRTWACSASPGRKTWGDRGMDYLSYIMVIHEAREGRCEPRHHGERPHHPRHIPDRGLRHAPSSSDASCRCSPPGKCWVGSG